MDPITRPAAWLVRHLPGSTGTLFADADDFAVEETLAYAPEGFGSHRFVQIRKRGLDTRAAARRLADASGIEAAEVGWAGLKDRHATAVQWLSVPATADDSSWASLEGIEVLQTLAHPKKLKPGHIRQNQFTITLRNVEPGGLERARAIADVLEQEGLPFAYGPQRQGRFQDNYIRAQAILRGEERPPRDRRLKRLFMSALQARAWGEVLGRRMEMGTWNRLIDGDLAVKHDERGGMFTVEDVEKEQPRAERLEVSPSGPLYGKKMRKAAGEAARLEDEVWASLGLDDAQRNKIGMGSRRSLRIPMGSIDIEAPTQDTLRFSFALPTGGYATVVLDAIVQPEVAFDRNHENRRQADDR